MIQANELRIRNYIMDRGNKMWAIECWESPTKVAAKAPYIGELFEKPMYGHPYTEEVNYLNPIPLTPEILEKCGIKDVWIKNSWKVIEDVSAGERFRWSMKVRNANYDKEIEFTYFKYLHQLQNLFFALTGEELQVNL